jgi:NAD(P)-dependent dehydrogenase (short-subunit alcohol dehydrogenase family)
VADLRFDGRVAVVTGGGRGIGRAHARLLAARGAHVVVNDLGVALQGGRPESEPARDVVAEIEAAGGTAVADGSDVAKTDGAEALVGKALDSFGRVDIVVNKAGIIRWAPFPEVDADDLAAHLSVHAAGSFNVSRAAWPQMTAQGYGRIVMTTSSAIFGAPTLVSYGAAKGAIVGLARSLATAGAEHGIAVNANGQIYAAGGGRASRVFIAETSGASIASPEDVRDAWAAINDPRDHFVPESTLDESLKRNEAAARTR